MYNIELHMNIVALLLCIIMLFNLQSITEIIVHIITESST